MYEKYVKRALDIICSIIAIVCLMPVFIVIMCISFFEFKGKIFFIQDRIGWKNKKFKIYKFKSMKDVGESIEMVKENIDSDKLRSTSWGRFLRKFSLDELPELINIFKGDMSFVGPRPLLDRYLDYYTDYELQRHNVRPGLTGLSQICGRNKLSWKKRFELDVKYTKNCCISLDIGILFKTFCQFIMAKDVVIRDENVMLDFDEERIKESCINEKKDKSIKYDFLSMESIELLNVNRKFFLDAFTELYKTLYRNNKYCCICHEQESLQTYINMCKFLEDESATIYIAQIDNKIIGFIWGYTIEKKESHKGMHVNYFFVDHEYRSSGIGSELMNLMIEHARKNGIMFLELNVANANTRAIKFYKKYNFEFKEKAEEDRGWSIKLCRWTTPKSGIQL